MKVFSILIAALFLSLALGLLIGPVNVVDIFVSDDPDVRSLALEVLVHLRGQRVLLAGLVGASLGVAGLLSQVTLQNPLSDPYLLGVSSGASFGAVVSVAFLRMDASLLPLAAFVGGGAGLALTLLASSRQRFGDPGSLLLTGAAVSFFLSALSLLGLNLAQTPDLPGLLFWIAGDCSLASVEKILWVAAASLPALAILWLKHRELEILETGTDEARSLGIDTRRLTGAALAAATLIAATCVAVSGMIGFVGLMVPHAARGLLGHSVGRGALGSALLGGAILVTADSLARSFPAVGELPVGSLTAVIGCPFLLYLLRRGALR